jgi:hypothetical protein
VRVDIRHRSGRFLKLLRLGRLWTRVLAGLAMIAAALLAISAALEVTPHANRDVAGQVIKVGAAPRLSLSGPGEVDLFGQGLPTAISIPGPIQPQLQLSQITLNSELDTFVQARSSSQSGRACARSWWRAGNGTSAGRSPLPGWLR